MYLKTIEGTLERQALAENHTIILNRLLDLGVLSNVSSLGITLHLAAQSLEEDHAGNESPSEAGHQ